MGSSSLSRPEFVAIPDSAVGNPHIASKALIAGRFVDVFGGGPLNYPTAPLSGEKCCMLFA
jgi:hypothetical protein